MKKILLVLALASASAAVAAESQNSTSVADVIKTFSHTQNVKIMAPALNEPVALYGVTPEQMNYSYVLTLLAQYGYSLVQYDDLYVVTPLQHMRSSSVPVVTEGGHYESNEIVTDVLVSQNLCASQLLPVLRPLVPQHAHLAAQGDGRAIVITDKYANIQRVAALMSKLDANSERQKKCEKPKPKELQVSKS